MLYKIILKFTEKINSVLAKISLCLCFSIIVGKNNSYDMVNFWAKTS